MTDPEYRARAIANMHAPEVREKARRSMMKKTYAFTDPNGTVFQGITDLRAFCAEHGLDYQSMRQVDYNTKCKVFHKWRKFIPAEETV
jgi:hypothetical protein